MVNIPCNISSCHSCSPYINPKATGKQVIFVSRCCIIGYGILSGVMAIILLKIGISLGWVYLFMGVCVGSAVVPIAFSITWAKCSGIAAITGAVGGLAGAVITWVVVAKSLYGAVTIDTLGSDYAMLAGNVVAIGLSGLLCVVVSLIRPDNYDWALMKEIPMGKHMADIKGGLFYGTGYGMHTAVLLRHQTTNALMIPESKPCSATPADCLQLKTA